MGAASFSQRPTEKMVLTESEQRLLASEIGSDHSLIKVWAKVWVWVWTMAWRWSDQMSIWPEKSGPWSGDGLIRCQFGLKSLDDGLEMVWSDVNLVWKVWTVVWRWSDQMSIWFKKTGRWSGDGLIRCQFGLKSLDDGLEMVWSDVNLV